MRNKEYQVIVIIDGVAILKTDYRSVSKGYADLLFHNITDSLQGVEGVNIVLYSREVQIEQQYKNS